MKLVIHYRYGSEIRTAAIDGEGPLIDIATLGRQVSQARKEDAVLSFSFAGDRGLAIPARGIELIEVSDD